MPKAWVRLEYNTENPKNFPRAGVLSDVDNAAGANGCEVEEFAIRKRFAFARFVYRQDREFSGAKRNLAKYDPADIDRPPPLPD